VPFTFHLVSRTARRDLEALGAGRRVARALGLAGAVASMALVMCAALTAVVLVNPSP
jgi:ABC-type Fe3+-siderophore transport system permease subunit